MKLLGWFYSFYPLPPTKIKPSSDLSLNFKTTILFRKLIYSEANRMEWGGGGGGGGSVRQ